MLVAGRAGAASAEERLLAELAEGPAADTAALALGYLRSPRAGEALAHGDAPGAPAAKRVALALAAASCERLAAEDFRTPERDQALQLAAVEAVVRCQGRHALEHALAYRQASHWREPEQVAEA